MFLIIISAVLFLFISFLRDDSKALVSTQKKLQLKNENYYIVLNDKKLNTTKEGRRMVKIYSSFMCATIGETCTKNPSDAPAHFQKSAMGYALQVFMLPIANPPASGTMWVLNSLENAGIVPKTYAAEGLGFGAIKPLANLWKIFRDFSYMLLVLVLLIIGFMIMFRMKINPQTVISIENALPKIIVTLLLITFSFAIVGFLIDLMYVLIAIAISLLSHGSQFFDAGKMQNMYLNGTGKELWTSVIADPNQGVWNNLRSGTAFKPYLYNNGIQNIVNLGKGILSIITTALPTTISTIAFLVINAVVGHFLIGSSLFDFLYKWLGTAFNDIVGIGGLPQLFTVIALFLLSEEIGAILAPILLIILLGLLMFFTFIFLFFRVFLTLFSAYLRIVVLTIFAPIILLFNAIPGKSTFSFWLKNIFVDLLTFPVVIILLIVGFMLTNQEVVPGSMWRPPFINAIDPTILPTILGIGIIFLIPDFVKIIKEAFGVKGVPIPIGLGTFFGGAGAGAGALMGVAGQISTINLGVGAFMGSDWLPKAAKKMGISLPGLRTPAPPGANPPADPNG